MTTFLLFALTQNATNISINGEATLEFLRPRMIVAFQVELDATGNPVKPIRKLRLMPTKTPFEFSGIGGGEYTIVAPLQRIQAKDGRIQVSLPSNPQRIKRLWLNVELPGYQIELAGYNDPRILGYGDKIESLTIRSVSTGPVPGGGMVIRQAVPPRDTVRQINMSNGSLIALELNAEIQGKLTSNRRPVFVAPKPIAHDYVIALYAQSRNGILNYVGQVYKSGFR